MGKYGLRRNVNMQKVKITNYSSFDNYVVKDKGTNHSDIVTKMVHLAGRICEKYASDIIYDANAFIQAIENEENFERFLFFREMGVTAFKADDVRAIEGTDYLQVWHLTYNAEIQEQEFKRVNVNLEKEWY
jgi:hypothetical protein